MSAEVEFCRPVPDGDAIFRNIPASACIEIDGILYIRQSQWVSFLEEIRKTMVYD